METPHGQVTVGHPRVLTGNAGVKYRFREHHAGLSKTLRDGRQKRGAGQAGPGGMEGVPSEWGSAVALRTHPPGTDGHGL